MISLRAKDHRTKALVSWEILLWAVSKESKIFPKQDSWITLGFLLEAKGINFWHQNLDRLGKSICGWPGSLLPEDYLSQHSKVIWQLSREKSKEVSLICKHYKNNNELHEEVYPRVKSWWYSSIVNIQQLSNGTHGLLNRWEIIPSTWGANYTWLVESGTLEENPRLPLVWPV